MSRSPFYDPFFGLIDAQLHPYAGHASQRNRKASGQPDNFYGSAFVRTPAVEMTEENREYVVEAELPGVRKEDLEVRVGSGGKTLTIEGKVLRRGWQPKTAQPTSPANVEGARPAAEGKTNGTEVTSKPTPEPEAESPYSAVFSRTFSLPRPVDGGKVRAKLENGVLLLHVPWMEEPGSVKVNID
ncbi:HSP20-like chaperone [Calocera cornea HHB12733]|uniref:HSP20-like chaperone n=1 Tax=Calocera cornea HHB12733 TaxID=1353952 RepID=A0A165GZ31_9BASI|nr:HSP20-like chaperone [Calocera cornea HHB12733]